MKDEIKQIVAILIIFIAPVILFTIELSNKNEIINKQNKKIKEQKVLINQQATELINKDDELCNCGWYEDFYYDHAEEFGANE